MINADNIEEGLTQGKDIALLVEMKFHNSVEQMVTYCTNDEYDTIVDDIMGRGDKIVECKRLNSKEHDSSLHIGQRELADKIKERLKGWSVADRKINDQEWSAINSLWEVRNKRSLSDSEVKMIQEMEQRASERTGRLDMIADVQSYLKRLGF
jgi:hypothetical protein